MRWMFESRARHRVNIALRYESGFRAEFTIRFTVSGGGKDGFGDPTKASELALQVVAGFGVERAGWRLSAPARLAIGRTQPVPWKLMRRVAGQKKSLMERQGASGEAEGERDKRTLACASGTRGGFVLRKRCERLAHVSAAQTKNLDVDAWVKRSDCEVARFRLSVEMRAKTLQQKQGVAVGGKGEFGGAGELGDRGELLRGGEFGGGVGIRPVALGAMVGEAGGAELGVAVAAEVEVGRAEGVLAGRADRS